VRIIGDQFLPAKLKIEEILIGMNDLPSWFQKFIPQFHSKNILRCSEGENGKTRSIYIDLKKIHEEIRINDITEKLITISEYKKSYFKQIESNVPASLCKILVLDDNASLTIANQIKDYFNNILGVNNEIEITAVDKISHEEIKKLSGTIFVVASCIASGRRLLAASRELRIFENLSIVYFIGITRVNDFESLDVLKKNLEFRKDPGKTNKFISVQTIFLPDEFASKKDQSYISWQKELEEFTKIRDNESKIPAAASEFIDQRIETLSQKGLNNQLFFNSHIENNPLLLRKNFAFWGFKFESTGVNQSEVFFTITALLHNIRSGCNNKTLQQHEHIRSLISPNNFHRFNDGIIQACLLRAAKNAELDYKIDSSYSNQMKTLLLSFFEKPKKNESEALLEFLYALYIGKMTLIESDLNEVLELLITNYYSDELVTFFVKLIYNKVSKESLNS
jgi:hypothetical protein